MIQEKTIFEGGVIMLYKPHNDDGRCLWDVVGKAVRAAFTEIEVAATGSSEPARGQRLYLRTRLGVGEDSPTYWTAGVLSVRQMEEQRRPPSANSSRLG